VTVLAVPFDYVLGLDLGQLHDFTALALLEEPCWIPGRTAVDTQALAPEGAEGWTGLDQLAPRQRAHWRFTAEQAGRPPDPPLYLRHLERCRGVPYPDVVKRVQGLLATPPLATAHVAVVVDSTGVGRGVTDLMYAVGLHPVCATIHGGRDTTGDLNTCEVHVPKRELIMAAQLALQQSRLRIAAGLPHATTLADELQNYRVKLSAAGHDSYNAREGEHDDLILATALAVWFRGWYCQHLDAAHAARKRSP
jgi:hypothetical protein